MHNSSKSGWIILHGDSDPNWFSSAFTRLFHPSIQTVLRSCAILTTNQNFSAVLFWCNLGRGCCVFWLGHDHAWGIINSLQSLNIFDCTVDCKRCSVHHNWLMASSKIFHMIDTKKMILVLSGNIVSVWCTAHY